MDQSKHNCTLTNSELLVKAECWIDDLIKTGGKAFMMQVPARPNADTDLILSETVQRFKAVLKDVSAFRAKAEKAENNIRNVLDFIAECKGSSISMEGRITAIENTLFRAIEHSGEKEPTIPQQGAVWVNGQYDRLYDQLKAEPERKIVCWVDYQWGLRDESKEILRDICSIMGRVMGFNARGIGYGGAEIWIGGEYEQKEFLEECDRLHVQWLDEGGEKEAKPEQEKAKYYTDEELRDIISMVCDQLNEGFDGREDFIDQTIELFASKKSAIEEWRKQCVKHPNLHLCDNRDKCGYPTCGCLPF